jgi:hypothetical protein
MADLERFACRDAPTIRPAFVRADERQGLTPVQPNAATR